MEVSAVRRLTGPATLALALIVLPATSAGAQNADLKNIWRQVTSGDVVRVKEASGLETRGVFTKLSESAVGVLVEGRPVEIPTANIREIRRRGESPVGGLLMGAAVGGGAAVAIFYSCDDVTEPTCMDWKRGTILGSAIGAGIGVAVDAAVRGWTVAYRDNGSSFALAPMVIPTAGGLRASISVSFTSR